MIMNTKEDQESFAMKAKQWKLVPYKNLDANNKECKSIVNLEAGKTKNEINTEHLCYTINIYEIV